jgi:hypothetical protein
LLENLQKKSSTEKEKIEFNYQNQLSSLEQKYQIQIKDLTDNYTKINTELINNNKELERELKSINIEMELRGKNLNSNDIDRKVTEMIAIQDKMKKEIDTLKKEREDKINEVSAQFEKEKEVLKNKNYEVENKLRELEGKRGQLLLETEKEKAKFSLERDHYDSKIKELQESLEKQEKRIETLLRDNEKLKNEKNTLKRPSSQSGAGRTMVNYTSTNTSVLGQNPNNYSILNNTALNQPIIPTSSYNKDPFTSNYSIGSGNIGSKLPPSGNSPFRKKDFNLDTSVNLNDNSGSNDLNSSTGSNISFVNKSHKYSMRPVPKDEKK